MVSKSERVEGGLIGLLIGDALGVPYEFHRPSEIPREDLIEMSPPLGFSRAHPGVPPGTWSDDGAQALCLLDSLLHRKGLDLEDFGRRMLDWYEHGYLAVDGKVFDVGVQTSSALLELRAGTPALKAGRNDERANGNGSLMRVLPLALWHIGRDESLMSDAMAQSRVTHGHMRSQVCCALYCLWARRVPLHSSLQRRPGWQLPQQSNSASHRPHASQAPGAFIFPSTSDSPRSGRSFVAPRRNQTATSSKIE